MELDIILLDTSVMIDYFRKTDKSNSFFEKLLKLKKGFCFSVITHFEIMIGSNEKQKSVWELILDDILLIDFHTQVSNTAVKVLRELKAINKLIPFQDIAIGATALHYNYPPATINEKHFKNISNIKLLTPGIFA